LYTVPENCCILGFGCTRDYNITPCVCKEKHGNGIYSICGWGDGRDGCIFCPPTKFNTTESGEQFSQNFDLNRSIVDYNKKNPENVLVTQDVTHFKGCLNGDYHHAPCVRRYGSLAEVEKFLEREQEREGVNKLEQDCYYPSPPGGPGGPGGPGEQKMG